jgi:catechol 2,3-dioxygenase-like lactoylglutathione lyase family enzyme
MSIPARYTHTNLIARDWRRLAAFYQDVFGCIPVPPERDLQGAWLESVTGIPGAHLRGMHLRLPGYGEHGPTLEIFQYEDILDGGAPAANRAGLGHLAFAVEDVAAACEALLAAGGGMLGKVVSVEIAGAGRITFAYATDPEGNLIELQRWGI